jgi:Protein of unknown function (DUF3303)
MRYLVIETYVGGAQAVYARGAERGRMLPPGLVHLDSWVEADSLERCFQLMETDEPTLFSSWIANWNDIIEFEIIPVIGSAEAAQNAGVIQLGPARRQPAQTRAATEVPSMAARSNLMRPTRESEMRFNWIYIDLGAIDCERMRDLFDNAWSS